MKKKKGKWKKSKRKKPTFQVFLEGKRHRSHLGNCSYKGDSYIAYSHHLYLLESLPLPFSQQKKGEKLNLDKPQLTKHTHTLSKWRGKNWILISPSWQNTHNMKRAKDWILINLSWQNTHTQMQTVKMEKRLNLDKVKLTKHTIWQWGKDWILIGPSWQNTHTEAHTLKIKKRLNLARPQLTKQTHYENEGKIEYW